MQPQSLRELVKRLQEPMKRGADVSVRDVMTDGDRVITVSTEATLKRVAELMVEHADIRRLPVVDADGRVVGVVSEADIVAGETAGRERRR